MQNGEKQKQILVLLGSPRKKGNSTTLAQQITKGAESAGAKVETIYLNGLNIKPCQGCYACKKKDSKGCVVDDDMQSLYPKMIASDAWVIATPVYWFNMTAQTKIFMDRCFGLFDASFTVNPLYKKKIAIAMSYGDSDPFNSGCVNALRSFQDAFRYVGAKIVGMVYGSAEEPGEIASNTELLEQAEALGKKLARS
ncbi:MAG: flavodoxin family protein [Deltaproteobacteria bacterium]|nr:flavodoxin family protein [Deltaproteobacteria bacterium]MBW2614407.1 flavodoxin family protein [Deltaproteobacteria bacterium]